jgi:hypothetical protein
MFTVGAVAALTMTGCGRPAGVDGDLTDNWPSLGTPEVFVPEAGVCHPRLQDVTLLAYRPVDCARPHLTETVYVGSFAGPDADRSIPPAPGSPAVRAARAECDKQADALLGGDWRSGRLVLALLVPRAEAWSGGARWYRCDLTEVESLDNDKPVARTGSLAGTLAGPSPLAYTCFNPKLIKDEINFMEPVPCDRPHHAEFAGIYTAAENTFEAFLADDRRTQKGCLTVIARFAKIPDDAATQVRVGSIFYHPDAPAWLDGNRGVQCFLWIDDREVTGSLRGAGPAKLPAR